jgi:glycerol uptake facilitator protein
MEKEPTLAQKLVAEFIGTCLLVLIGAGSVTAALTLTPGKITLADLGMIGFAFAFIIMAMIFAIGRVSGCVINPAIAIALAVTKRLPWNQAVPYIVVEYLGGILGGFLIYELFQPAKATMNLGVNSFAAGHAGQGFLAEALGTFILVLAVYGSAVDRRAPAGWAALTIGLIVAGVVITLGPVSGQGINPARYFGAFINQAWFGGTVQWDQVWVYTTAPVVGAVAAAFTYDFLNGKEPVPQAEPEHVREVVSREPAGASAG